MGDFIKLLRAYTDKHRVTPITLQGLIDLFYTLYTDAHPIENEPILQAYADLEELLSSLPLSDNNAVFQLVAALCELHSRRGFEAGASVGCEATHYIYRSCGENGGDTL